MSEQDSETLKDAEGKNALNIYCCMPNCTSLILRPSIATWHQLEKSLPAINSVDKSQEELVSFFWRVDDIYHFENLSFSNTVDTTKFLSCCDCDSGPIGFQDLSTNICYVACNRVKYQCSS